MQLISSRATDQIEQMKTLLQDIRTRASKDDRRKIDNVLAQVWNSSALLPCSLDLYNLTSSRS